MDLLTVKSKIAKIKEIEFWDRERAEENRLDLYIDFIKKISD